MRIDLGLQRTVLVFQHFILCPVFAGLFLPHLNQQPPLVLQHSVEMAGQLADFIAADHRNPKLQIPGCGLVHRAYQQVNLTGHPFGDHQHQKRAQRRAEQAGQGAGQHRRAAHLPQDGFRQKPHGCPAVLLLDGNIIFFTALKLAGPGSGRLFRRLSHALSLFAADGQSTAILVQKSNGAVQAVVIAA